MSKINFDGEQIFNKMPGTQKFSTLTKLLIKISGGRIKSQKEVNYIFVCISVIAFILMGIILFLDNQPKIAGDSEIYINSGYYQGEKP